MKKIDKKILLKRASEDVRELERYIKEFSTFLPLPVCLINSSKVIIDVNSAFLKLSGYLESEIMGQKIEKMFAKNKIISAFLKKLFKEKKILKKEVEFLDKNNQISIVNLFASPRKNHQNKIVGYFLAMSNIDELKKLQNNLEGKVKERTEELQKTHDALLQTLEEVNIAKAEIEKEQKRTGAILSNFLDPVVVVDNNNKIIFLNPAAEKIFGSAKEALGKNLKSKSKRFSFQDFQEIINQKFEVREIELDKHHNPVVEEVIIYSNEEKNEEESPFSADLSKKGKESIVYKVLTATVCDEKNICFGRMKLFYDLTREKMIDKMKTEFISIAAHQLRTPLSATKWAIKMVVDGDMGNITEIQKDILMKGYISNERVIGLINDMLYVSKIEEGRFGYTFGVGDISEVLDKIFNESKEDIKNKSINLKIKKPNIIPKISLDKEKMELAIRNIFENSIRYTPENGKIEAIVKLNKNLKLIIKDNGVGIPKDNQKKLFTKFFRGENVVRMQTEGSGLGLFIVKNIIEKHGGKIEIKSEEGNGTEVIITLPLIKK